MIMYLTSFTQFNILGDLLWRCHEPTEEIFLNSLNSIIWIHDLIISKKRNDCGRMKSYSIQLSIKGTEAHPLSQSHPLYSAPISLTYAVAQKKPIKGFLPTHLDSVSLAIFQMQSR